MKKLGVVLGLLSMFAFCHQAAAQFQIGTQGSVALPMGDFGDADGIGFGGSLSGKYAITEAFNVGARFGYLTFSEGDIPGSGSIISYGATADYAFGEEGFRPYFGVDVGLYNVELEVDLGFLGTVSASETEFGFAPKGGFYYGLSDAIDLDVNSGYYFISDANFAAVNIGIVYKIGS